MVPMNYPDELIFLKNRKSPQKQSNLDLKDKRVVLTGATSGIGLATAHRLAKAQAELILIVRDHVRGQALKQELIDLYGVKVDLVIADFLEFETVRQAADSILNKYKKIDILINNAGIHSTKYKTSPSGFEQVLATNHLASFLLTQLLYPLIRNAQGRIIFVNSEGHRFSRFIIEDIEWKKRHYTGLRSYGASKTAQLLAAQALAKRSVKDKVCVISMHPGDVKSRIGQNNGWLYRLFSRFFIQPILQDVMVASDALHFLSVDPSVLEHPGEFYHLTLIEKPAKHAQDEAFAEKVYQQTCAWLKLESSI
jgi:NAD(P)-dependent dehydrogenase (short-subunit alcohol dehydrogenase family)